MNYKKWKMIARITIFTTLVLILLGISGLGVSFAYIFAVTLASYLIASGLGALPSENKISLKVVPYFLWLLKEVFMSSVAVAKIACRKNLRIQPLLEPVKSGQKTEIGTVVYANSITLTPGTATLSTEDNILLVHALDCGFMDDLKSGEMDDKVSKIIK